MKAQRRHELKTNALLAALNRSEGWAEAHKRALTIGIVLVAAVIVVAYMWARRSAARPTEAWDELAVCEKPDQYRAFLADYGSTRAATEARLELGRLLVEEAVTVRARDPVASAATKKIDEARDLYQVVLDGADGNQYDGARALMGLATLAEMGGRQETALGLYERIEKQYPAAGFVTLAADRSRVLRSPHRPKAPEPMGRPSGTEAVVPIPPLGETETDTGDATFPRRGD